MHQNDKAYLQKHETAQNINNRLFVFASEYKKYKSAYHKSLKILDIGSGKNPVLFSYIDENDFYSGCDYYETIENKEVRYVQVDLNNESLSEKFKNELFDVIFCGEVIEHLFSPDYLVQEIKKLMHPESILILSTPNLGYYLNRLMLLFGISPFFLENSSEYKFGRKWKIFGNMNSVEGHIKLFTFGALKEFLLFYKFEIIRTVSSTGPWSFFLDSVVAQISRSLAATNIFVVRLDRRNDGR